MTTARYVDVEDALDFCEMLDLFIGDEGALATALARPAVVVWGAEAYEGLHVKGAALLDALTRSHALLDGNKRLSWTMTDVLYRLNGYRLVADPHEVDRFVRAVGGDEHLPLQDVASWLESHAHPLED